MVSTSKFPIHNLPLPSRTLQQALPQLKLEDKPSSQRRSTTFSPSTEGIWARVEPLWTSWPLSLTKEEVEDMGVDVNSGGRVDVEAVLRRWDPVDDQSIEGDSATGTGTASGNGLNVMSSTHRLKADPYLLGVSESAIKHSLPHLDVGDALDLCTTSNSALDEDSSPARQSLIDIISGRKVLKNDTYGPWSTRYCGHQFGVWAGQLGDGRAISILETESQSGGRQEIQLKGSGRTPFSRTADGLAVLRSGVREYLGCEAIAALKIPTTRALAILTTNIESLPVQRENGPEPSSLVARLAPSFIRLGHFEALNPGESGKNSRQFFMGSMGGWGSSEEDPDDLLGGQGNLEGLVKLVEWVREDVMQFEGGVADWAREVVRRNAEMVAAWQVYGFMHGVLNTDNISVLGLTIDYGPYAFMDVWDDNHICNHSDPSGLYSYRNQPSRILFGLDSFISTLLPLIGYEAINTSPPTPGFSETLTKADVADLSSKGLEVMEGWNLDLWKIERAAEISGWRRRFGLKEEHESDGKLVKSFLDLLHSNGMDFNISLRRLSTFVPTRSTAHDYSTRFISDLIEESTTSLSTTAIERAETELKSWLVTYSTRVTSEKQLWISETVSQSEEDIRLYGVPTMEEGEGEGEEGGEEWELKRSTLMKRQNPKFVLRQWVLEETIARLEKMEDITQARLVLAKILDMASRPFFPWGEDGHEIDKRLCGLGSKAMLGFQCSCSS